MTILGSNDLLVRLGRDESEDDEKNMWVQEQDVIFERQRTERGKERKRARKKVKKETKETLGEKGMRR